MTTTSNVSNELLLRLKSLFPSIKMGDSQGMTTVDPKKAVFFDFDFIVKGEKIASVSISIADDGVLKLFYTRDMLNDIDQFVKDKWFKFLRLMRQFAKKNLMTFEPNDIMKKNLDKRDYEQMSVSARSNNPEENKMTESALYGSTKSSYQKLENTRLIIRHSQKVDEGSINSRTRNIDSIYIENAQGERFRYPFNHLSGARAMMRHLANGGYPYDQFGQYIVGLSEQVYNLRKFNNLMHRNAFLENTELTNIAVAARQKTNNIKKVIERIQKQSGYNAIKENFTEYKRSELNPDMLNSLKERFTIQQFNEELVELFPYISDLISEEQLDEISKEKLGSYVRSASVDLYKKGAARKSEISKGEHDTPNKRKAEKRISGIHQATQKLAKEEAELEEGGLAEIGRMLSNTSKMGEAGKKTDDPTAADAAAEPIGKVPFIGRAGDDVGDLQHTIKNLPEIRVEPFDKNSIIKYMDKTQAQIKQIEGMIADNPKDKKLQYSLEKAQARLGLLQARLGTADTQSGNAITRIGLFIDHLSKHVKDDNLALILSRVGDAYSSLSKQERQEVNGLISTMLKKAKYVPMFSAESTSFEELECMIQGAQPEMTSKGERINPVQEYEQLLSRTIDEQSDILSTDLDVRNRAIGELNHLISDEFPVGTNGVNAIESLRGIIDDSNLFKQFMEMSQKDSAADARQQIIAWVQGNAPDVMSELDVKGIEMPKLNKAPEEDGDIDQTIKPKVDDTLNEVEDFVKSLYDRHTGNFPRGETGVLTSVAKKFGDNAVPVAQKVIEGLKQSFDENIMRMRKLAGVS